MGSIYEAPSSVRGISVSRFLGAVSDGPKTDETCRFENRVLAGGSKTPSEGCSDGGVRLDWFSVQGGLIWSLVR
jgi:hypothetical protein